MITVDAASDAGRYLLRAVLEDAREWHFAAMDACPGCRAAGGCCIGHWDAHQEPVDAYGTLALHLAAYDGSARACPLNPGQQRLIAEAVAEATAYRTEIGRCPADPGCSACFGTGQVHAGKRTPEPCQLCPPAGPLAAAYHELERQLAG